MSFLFWAKLSDDYKDSENKKLKDSQKTVQFQPYYVNGNDKEVYDTTWTDFRYIRAGP